ncbi:hypothetical protein [Paenibacillus sp. SI8]|uniref:hypothetical protein n=1 Tax=unclassified Paenibacillus TaxID=185978 RepID=UPI0034651BAA
MTKTNVINLTPDYRLTTDGDRNFILERHHTVDPAKAPGYKAQEGAAPPPVRDEWRPDAYYGFTAVGLAAAISTVSVRSAWGNTETIADYIEAIAEERRRLTELTSGVIA